MKTLQQEIFDAAISPSEDKLSKILGDKKVIEINQDSLLQIALSSEVTIFKLYKDQSINTLTQFSITNMELGQFSKDIIYILQANGDFYRIKAHFWSKLIDYKNNTCINRLDNFLKDKNLLA